MGVMQCDRRNCEEILCDRCILSGAAYICGHCFSELVAFRETWPDEMFASDVEARIREFMDSPKGTHRKLDRHDIDREFGRLTESPTSPTY